MSKYLTVFSYILIALFLTNCASGPSSVEFTSAKTKARSERNLKEAEKYALQAMEIEIHQNDAEVPYFIATEIYKPQKKWAQMSEMLDEAMRRNPEQKLKEPKYLTKPENITRENFNESIAYTIGEAVVAYRKELWVTVYNESITKFNNGDNNAAIELLILTIDLDPNNVKSYVTLSKAYRLNNELDLSKNIIDRGLDLNDIKSDEKAELHIIKAEILKLGENYVGAIGNYTQAYEFHATLDDQSGMMSAMVAILSLNLLLEDWMESIQWAEKIYEDFYLVNEDNEMDILFNISLAYNNAASSYYNLAGKVFNSDNPNRSELQESKNNYNIAYEYFDMARDYFIELEDMGSDNGASMAITVKDYMDLIDEIQVPFVQKQLDSLNSN
jgi:tetratricopeptide (TPR) repeat protein